MTTTILLNLDYKKSKTYNFTVKCYGKRTNDNGSTLEHNTPKAISGCGYDKVDTAKAQVLNELFTQDELKYCFDSKIYGVYKSSLDDSYYINGGCGCCDNIARFLQYQVITCNNSILYIK